MPTIVAKGSGRDQQLFIMKRFASAGLTQRISRVRLASMPTSPLMNQTQGMEGSLSAITKAMKENLTQGRQAKLTTLA